MIETKKEWKRAFKGILIFIGSAFVLLALVAILRPSSDDLEPVSSVQEEKKKKEPVYSLEKQYADYMDYYFMPLYQKEYDLLSRYHKTFLPNDLHSLEDKIAFLKQTFETSYYYQFAEEAQEEAFLLHSKIEKLSLPKDFPQEDVENFNKSKEQLLLILETQQEQYALKLKNFDSFKATGLSFEDYLMNDSNLSSYLNKEATYPNQYESMVNSLFVYFRPLAKKYNYDVRNYLDSSESSTPL